MSANANWQDAQSPRDDLEAVGFMLMSFLRGNLPWDGSPGYKDAAWRSQVVNIKENLDFKVNGILFGVSAFIQTKFLFCSAGLLPRICAATGRIFPIRPIYAEVPLEARL